MASTIFNYTGVKDTVNFAGGLPGQAAIVPGPTYRASVLVANGQTLENGQLVKLSKSNGSYLASAIASGDAASVVAGVVMQDVTSQKELVGIGKPQFIYAYPAGTPITLLRTGYIYVPVQNASPTITWNNSIYMRNATSAGNAALPIGGVESATGTGNVEVSAIKFTGETGFPLSGNQNGSVVVNGVNILTGRTALVKVDLGLL